jgi:hypothetical protein
VFGGPYENQAPVGFGHDNSNNQTSYMTPSNYVVHSQGPNDASSYNTNISQMYQHPVLPSMPVFPQNNLSQLTNYQAKQDSRPACSENNLKPSDQEEASVSQRTHDGGYQKMSKESRALLNKQAIDLKSGSSRVHPTTGQATSSYRSNGTGSRRTAEEYEAQITQFEELAAQYEKEMNELRHSNMEQNQDLHTMIQTVNELKEKNGELAEEAGRKEEEIEQVKCENHDQM